jgi:hypothetical protein
MAKLKIVGNAVVITSELTAEQLTTVKKFTKDGLKLKDEKGNEIFAIAFTPGRSSISEHGINYGEVNAEGFAQATLLLDESIKAEDRMNVVLDTYAIGIGNLKALETYIREAATSITKTVEDIKDSIEVL